MCNSIHVFNFIFSRFGEITVNKLILPVMVSYIFLLIYKVLVKNLGTNIQRIGQAIVLDPPMSSESQMDDQLPSSADIFPHADSSCVMLVFPSYHFPQSHSVPLTAEVSYLSSLLAFNLNLHLSCLNSLVQQGKGHLSSLFNNNANNETNGKGAIEGLKSTIRLSVESWSGSPKFASHLRASFVKLPESGTLESLKSSSSVEAEDRQRMIDLALNDYFSVDRYLARGDLFRICINWNCNSTMCIPCDQRNHNTSDNAIYFKVSKLSILLCPKCRRSLRDCNNKTYQYKYFMY